jgi:alpha-amylase
MAMRRAVLLVALAVGLLATAAVRPVSAQAGFEDDRVMLQGFYWESYRHGHPGRFPAFGDKHWYRIVAEQAPAIRTGRFDLVWLPPPSYAGEFSAGYDPKEYFKLSNSYGTQEEHRAALAALLGNGIEPVADVVINHRDSSACPQPRPRGCWAIFKNPDWGLWAITRDDEAFSDSRSEAFNTPIAQRGAPEERALPYARGSGSTFQYGDFRDIDHGHPQVRRDVIRYLLQLRSLGYRGWRYDMVHGYHAHWLAVYNRASKPSFSVGEYDWGKQDEWRGWAWHSATDDDTLETGSSVFDFRTMFTLKEALEENRTSYGALHNEGRGIGLVGDTTDGVAWRNRAVTFVENHDTGYRTGEDGKPEKDHERDSFADGRAVEQAYAHILTHPGVPTVFWKHYFDKGEDLRGKLVALINARKVAGVHAGSSVDRQANANQNGVYAARVRGRNGDLFVRIGGEDAAWQPGASGYRGFREYAAGAGWKVWVALPGDPPVQQAAMKPALPVPDYRPPETIMVPDDALN